MKNEFGCFALTSLVLVLFASMLIPAYAAGAGSDRSYQVASVTFKLFDPDNTNYYGPSEFYTPFGYYPYSRYLNPPPPVWIPPAPMTLAPYVVARWTDPNMLTVMWAGETRRTKRISVVFYDKARTLRSADSVGPLFQPYSLSFATPTSAAFMRVTTFDGAGRVLKDILTPLPPQ